MTSSRHRQRSTNTTAICAALFMAIAAVLLNAEVHGRGEGLRRVATTTWVPGLGRLVVAAAVDLHVSPSLAKSLPYATGVVCGNLPSDVVATNEEIAIAVRSALPPPAATRA